MVNICVNTKVVEIKRFTLALKMIGLSFHLPLFFFIIALRYVNLILMCSCSLTQAVVMSCT